MFYAPRPGIAPAFLLVCALIFLSCFAVAGTAALFGPGPCPPPSQPPDPESPPPLAPASPPADNPQDSANPAGQQQFTVDPSSAGQPGPYFHVQIISFKIEPREFGKPSGISAAISHDLNGLQDFILEVSISKAGKEVFRASETVSGMESGIEKKVTFREKWNAELPGTYAATIKAMSPDRQNRYNSQRLEVRIFEAYDDPLAAKQAGGYLGPGQQAQESPAAGGQQQDLNDAEKGRGKRLNLDLGFLGNNGYLAIMLFAAIIVLVAFLWHIFRSPA
ncbi:Uncharacterised protein [uncultured archaeon]|nr:Uncharacterised protein [uncultured archaeon]